MAYSRAVLALFLSLVLGATSTVVGTVATSAAVSCDNAPLPGAPTVRVLVMGDSLTHQHAGDWSWRYRFWQYERQQGVNIDFVGPYNGLLSTWDTLDADQAANRVNANTSYADPCFLETQHFAVGGKDLAETLVARPFTGTSSEVAWATQTYQPDVVLGLMGYNDLKPFKASDPWGHHGYSADAVLANAKTFVDQVRAAKPGTPVALGTVASTPGSDVKVNGGPYNAKLAAAVPTWNAPGAPVGLVDITKHWKYLADTWDSYHPNANGEMHLAWDVSDGLSTLDQRIVPLSTKYDPIPVQPLGPRGVGAVSVASGTPSSVTLTWTFPPGADREVLEMRDATAGTDWAVESNTQYARSATVDGLAQHVYEFRVRAAKGTAFATDLHSPTITADLRPSQRIGAIATGTGYHAALVGWASVPTSEAYQVRWRRAGSTVWTTRTTTSTTYRIGGLLAGTRYAVTVAPVRDRIVAAAGAAVTGVIPGTVNPAVPRPRVAAVSGHRARITWNRAARATRYQVLIRRPGAAWATLGWSTSPTFTTPKLAARRTYSFAVVAWDSFLSGRTSGSSRFKAR